MGSDILESYEEKLNINHEFFGLFRDELLKISIEEKKNINFKSSSNEIQNDNNKQNLEISNKILPNILNDNNKKLNIIQKIPPEIILPNIISNNNISPTYNLSKKEIIELNNIILYFSNEKK